MPKFFARKKKEEQKETKEPVPKYVEAWGWAASAARFRGLICMVLSFALVISLIVSGALYFTRDVVIVGVAPTGERMLLEPVSQGVNLEVFVRHFLGFYANYSPTTINDNIGNAMKLATKPFRDSFNYVLGTSFIQSVIQDKIVQSVAVSRVEISSLREGGFKAMAYATRYRSVNDETKQVVYEIDIVKGPISKDNPYGYYVNSLKESNI